MAVVVVVVIVVEVVVQVVLISSSMCSSGSSNNSVGTISNITINIHFQIVQGLDRFKIYLDYYQELSKDYTTKCIKLCVTSSPTGKPRCNLNTTTGYATASFRPGSTLSYPRPNTLWYSFSKWEVSLAAAQLQSITK